MQNCSYCVELKERLDKLELDYEERDINQEENKEEFAKICELSKTETVPVILVGKNILVADLSFKTIEEASIIIKKLH